ncbi:MAG TPA: hypothetical protein VGD61_03025 [Pyrinomonadaceae bacterium]
MLGKRSSEAIKELEALQQQERKAAGEPELTHEAFLALLRDDIHQQLISQRLEAGGLDAVLAGSGDDEKEVERIFTARMNNWRLDDPSQWSRYETPGSLFGLANICSRIEAVYNEHNWKLPQFPAVGTLTTGQVSAVTQRTPNDSILVLIDNAFFRFAGIMSQLAIFSTKDLQLHGQFSEATYQLMSDLVATHTVLNTCLYVYPRKTPEDLQRFVANLQDAIIMFVISHEYAHIKAGDLDAHPFKGEQQNSDLREKEFEADKLGFITTMEATAHSDQAGSGVFGPFLYFAGLDLLTRAADAYHDRTRSYVTSPDSDYPTPYERTVNLLDWLETTPYVPAVQPQISGAATCYNVIIDVWDQIAPVFRAAREDLSAADPAIHGPSPRPREVDTQYVVGLLWARLLAYLRQRG